MFSHITAAVTYSLCNIMSMRFGSNYIRFLKHSSNQLSMSDNKIFHISWDETVKGSILSNGWGIPKIFNVLQVSWIVIESELSKDVMMKCSNVSSPALKCLEAEMSLTAYTTVLCSAANFKEKSQGKVQFTKCHIHIQCLQQ